MFVRLRLWCCVLGLVGSELLGWGSLPLWAQEGGVVDADRQPRRQQLEQRLKDILEELDRLKEPMTSGERAQPAPSVVKEQVLPEAPGVMPEVLLEDMSIVSTRVQLRSEGISLSATVPSETDSQPTRHLKESMESLPGVILRQANGPRDFSIAIRGSGVKTSFAVREVKMYEDGFIQTQSDGLSRLDIHDPWFMRSVEVLRGASSSLYDNYALGGMVHFRTRRGRDINGVETFLSGGSYGYHKEAFAVGQQFENLDISLFASNVGEDGFIRNSRYLTQTINFNFRFKVDDKQNFYFKAISNWLDSRVPTRLTQAQFQADERQAGGAHTSCVSATSGCQDAERLRQSRIDRRTIVGGMYERQIDASTVLTLEADYDVKDINQTFNQISDNVNPNYKHYADLRHEGRVLDMPLRSYMGVFANRMEQEGQTFQNMADGLGTRGTLVQNSRGYINNIGARIREELEFVPKWIVAAGLGFEHSHVNVQAINYSGTGAFSSRANADRDFSNWAPEMSLSWKPAEGYRHWVRASTGYAIPQFGQLTRDPVTGAPGTNFSLKPQKNLNFEIGTESKLRKDLTIELVGFMVFVKDEFITQNINSTVNTATVNADSSRYRGVEVAYDWRPWSGWRFSGAYTHTEARYTNFTDVTQTATLVRDGKRVPNVPSDVLNFKEAYDHPSGWGGWFETSYYNSYSLNNNNTIGIPAYWLMNANLHKTWNFQNSWVRFAKLYVEMDNIIDKKYAASGQVVGAENPSTTNLLYFAGYGRSIYGGLTLGVF